MKKDKPYYYCMECGYIGTKEKSKRCNHEKHLQLPSDYPLDMYESHEHTPLAIHPDMREWIQKNTGMDSILTVRKEPIDSEYLGKSVCIVLNLSLTSSRKPKYETAECIEILSNAGYRLYFADTENHLEGDHRMLRLLTELARRYQAKHCKAGQLIASMGELPGHRSALSDEYRTVELFTGWKTIGSTTELCVTEVNHLLSTMEVV